MKAAGDTRIKGTSKLQPCTTPALLRRGAATQTNQPRTCRPQSADGYQKGGAIETWRSYFNRINSTVTSVRQSLNGDVTVTASDGSAARLKSVATGKRVCVLTQVKSAGGRWKTIDNPCAPSPSVEAEHRRLHETHPLLRMGNKLADQVKETIINAVNAKHYAPVENALICFAESIVYRVDVRAISKNKLLLAVSYTPKGSRRIAVTIPLHHVVRVAMHGGGIIPSYRPFVACLSSSQRALFAGADRK